MSNTTDIKAVAFAAIDPYLQTNIVAPTETENRGRHFVEWGDRNQYPEYLLDLFNNVPTLRTIISRTADFVCGDDIIFADIVKGLDRNAIHDIALDDGYLGGFALQVIRAGDGSIAEVHYIDTRFLRSDKDNEVFRYSEKWKKGGRDVIVYPRFRHFAPEEWKALAPEEKARHGSSIYYVKNTHTQTYPAPVYAAAVKDCEIERGIADYHLNNLENGFMASMIINFNNGVPTDEIRKQIEREANEKFSGHQNAGRMMFSWNASRVNETTFYSPKIEDFTAKYTALEKSARQNIFTAFGCVPALFGINPEGNGFSETEYSEAFRLYNRTAVRPAQRRITDALEDIYGVPVLTIRPYTLGTTTETNVQ